MYKINKLAEYCMHNQIFDYLLITKLQRTITKLIHFKVHAFEPEQALVFITDNFVAFFRCRQLFVTQAVFLCEYRYISSYSTNKNIGFFSLLKSSADSSNKYTNFSDDKLLKKHADCVKNL